MEKKKDLTGTEALGWLVLVLLQFGSMFYKILLGMVTWNLYLADYTFTVGYWQMFLIVMVFGMTFGGSGLWKLELEAKLNQISGKRAKVSLGLEESFKQTSKTYLFNTITFGILYVIYTLI
jgi:hypothetical protein